MGAYLYGFVMKFSVVSKVFAAVRVRDWWHFILPPIIGFYFFGVVLSASMPGLPGIINGMLYLMFLAIPVAAYGFFINEWTDIADDIRAGKQNYVVPLSVPQRAGILFAILVLIIAAQILLPLQSITRWLVFIQLCLLSIYSCKPFRLKRLPWAALTLDALYSGTVFFVLAVLMHGHLIYPEVIVLTLVAGLLKGARNIIYHFLQDEINDEASGQVTLAHLMKKEKLIAWQEVMWYAEAMLLLLLGFLASPLIFWLIFSAIMVALIKRRYYTRFNKGYDKDGWLGQMNTLYEVWLPAVAIFAVLLPWGWWTSLAGIAVMMLIFPATIKLFSELYLAVLNVYYLVINIAVYIWHRIYYFCYNIYYGINDLYFIHTKPHFDIGKFIRKLKGK